MSAALTLTVAVNTAEPACHISFFNPRSWPENPGYFQQHSTQRLPPCSLTDPIQPMSLNFIHSHVQIHVPLLGETPSVHMDL